MPMSMRFYVKQNLVAEENEDFAINGLRTFNETNGAVLPVLQWIHSDAIKSTLPMPSRNTIAI